MYEAPSYYSDAASYNIISLKECQGFIFNQDLFATPYQQLRSQAIERKYRASFSNKHRPPAAAAAVAPISSKSTTPEENSQSGCTKGDHAVEMQRRHTSYHPSRPSFGSSALGILLDGNAGSAIDDDSMEDAAEGYLDDVEMSQGHVSLSPRDRLGVFEEEEEEYDDDDEDEDEDDEYQEMRGYHGDVNSRRYKVKVTEIIINEKDSDIFPH